MTPRGSYRPHTCSCPHPSLSPGFPLVPRVPSSLTPGFPNCSSGFPFWPHPHSPQGMDNEAGGRVRGGEGETPRDISAGGRERGGWLESLGRNPKS